MRESVKTAWFVGLALVVGLVAFVSRPVPPKKHKGEDTPVELFDGPQGSARRDTAGNRAIR